MWGLVCVGRRGERGVEDRPPSLNVLHRNGLFPSPSRNPRVPSISSCITWFWRALRALLIRTNRRRRGSTPWRTCSCCSFRMERSKRFCCCRSRSTGSREGRLILLCITHTAEERESTVFIQHFITGRQSICQSQRTASHWHWSGFTKLVSTLVKQTLEYIGYTIFHSPSTITEQDSDNATTKVTPINTLISLSPMAQTDRTQL